MAHPSTECNDIRDKFTTLSDNFLALATDLQRYQDLGEDYYTDYSTDGEGTPTTDITAAEFHTAVQVLAGMAASLTQQQWLAIAKMRR